MNPIKQSIKYLLLNSKVYFAILLVFIISILIIERGLSSHNQELNLANHFFGISVSDLKSIALFFSASIFLGVYLGGGLANLKKNYLWKVSNKYKNSLLHGYFIITFVINAILVLGLYSSSTNVKLMLLLPFCFSVFASQMVLGKNLLIKVLVTPIPLIVAQLYRLNTSIDVIIMLIVLATAVLIFTMYKNLFYQFGANLNVGEDKNNANLIAYATTGLNASQLNTINHRVGLVVAKWITNSKKLIDWAILMPHTRVTLTSLYYVAFMLVTLLLTGNKTHFLQLFVFLFLPMIIIITLIESRNLFRQTKTIAHVYGGKQHHQLKNTILFALDKNIAANILVFLICVLFTVNLFSITLVVKTMILSVVGITVISFAVYPYLLCLNWVNLSVLLIGSMFVYILVLYKFIKWIGMNPDLAMTLPYVVSFTMVCLLLRGLTQYIFWKRPFEALLK